MISLSKGNKVNLRKESPNLTNVNFALGWDMAEGSITMDCDAFAFLVRDGRCRSYKDVISYMNLAHESGCIRHSGDNLTGAGSGDKEVLRVSLERVPSDVTEIVFGVSIYMAMLKFQTLKKTRNLYIRVDDVGTNTPICEYRSNKLHSNSRAMLVGRLIHSGNEWIFEPLDIGLARSSIQTIAKRYKSED